MSRVHSGTPASKNDNSPYFKRGRLDGEEEEEEEEVMEEEDMRRKRDNKGYFPTTDHAHR